MDMTGEERIEASREVVWAALNNPGVLRKCIPGCQSLERISDNEMAAKVRVKAGPIAASFNGKVTLEKVNPPESYTLLVEGAGGFAGSAQGSTDVVLRQDGDITVVTYTVRAKIGGRLSLVPRRLIDSGSQKVAKQFFQKLNRIVTRKP